MSDRNMLLELTESYLKNLIADVSGQSDSDFDSSMPFRELGIDSFYVLKVLKRLEFDFGHLPKTLLFENFNIDDLAQYFVDKYALTLTEKFSLEPDARTMSESYSAMKRASTEAEPPIDIQVDISVNSSKNSSIGPDVAIRLLEKDAYAKPGLGKILKDILSNTKMRVLLLEALEISLLVYLLAVTVKHFSTTVAARISSLLTPIRDRSMILRTSLKSFCSIVVKKTLN